MEPISTVIDDIRPGARQYPPDTNASAPQSLHEARLYEPLKENEIRVLEILPGLGDDMIISRLKIIKLGTSNYYALSYAWGDLRKAKIPLFVDGHVLQATENCISALKELRREFMTQSESCFIWIDAICINQVDVTERNQQLLAMTQIYQNSSKLIVWLGIEGDGSQDAIEIMKTMPRSCGQQDPEERCETCDVSPERHQHWLSLASFFSRSWFTRVWIIQEYLACSQTTLAVDNALGAGAIEFYCGTSRISPAAPAKIFRHTGWFTLKTFRGLNIDLGRQNQIKSLYISFRRGVMCFLDILQRAATPLCLSSSERTAHHFLQCIVTGLDYDSTEPRDRVYAHLPLHLGYQNHSVENLAQQLAKDLWQQLIRGSQISNSSPIELLRDSVHQNSSNFSKLIIDYNRSIEDVYSSVVCYMLFATKSLNILSLCYKRSSHVRRTWTVDLTAASFDEKGCPQAGGLLTLAISNSSFFKSFRASNGVAADAHFSSDLSILSVKGFRVTDIAMPIGHPEDFGPELQIGLLDKLVLRELISGLTSCGVFETLQVAQKVLWDTILAGTGFENKIESFQRWRSWLNTDAESLELWVIVICRQLYRRLFLASNKRIGKGWNLIKQGDLICVILGCDVPLVLRPVGKYYELIGDCYTDGIMNGEAMKDFEDRNRELEVFELR